MLGPVLLGSHTVTYAVWLVVETVKFLNQFISQIIVF